MLVLSFTLLVLLPVRVESGAEVTCARCPPGTFLRSACTETRKSECAPCPTGSFTELWNRIERCLRCRVCGRNQVTQSACTSQRDRVCACKEGFYFRAEHDMCVRHSACPPGTGVLSLGTPVKDTVCQRCSNQTFSDSLSARESCSRHTSCSDGNMLQVLRGSSRHDSVCVSCTDQKDPAHYLARILPSFFLHHRLNLQTLHRIGLRPRSEDDGPPELHAQIESWVKAASRQQIRDLPLLLREAGAPALQRKLQRMVRSLQRRCSVGAVERRA